MANTAGGLPYPIGTDKVVNGDDAIKALADKLDAVFRYAGTVRFYLNADAAGPASGVWGRVPLNATNEASGVQAFGIPGGGVLTVTKAGIYAVSAAVTMSATAFAARLTLNGATVAQDAVSTISATTTLSLVRFMAAGAAIALDVLPASAGTTIKADAAAAPTTMTVLALPYG